MKYTGTTLGYRAPMHEAPQHTLWSVKNHPLLQLSRPRWGWMWGVALLLQLVLGANVLAQPVFTGDAQADFNIPGAFFFEDPGTNVDVGVPAGIAASGWDLRGIYIYYDQTADQLYVGVDCYDICGDADADGDPGGTSAALMGAGGSDLADLGGTEAIVVMFDVDNDFNMGGNYEVVVGVNNMEDVSGFGTHTFTGSVFAPFDGSQWTDFAGSPSTLFGSPSPGAPDFEFRVDNFTMFPGLVLDPMTNTYTVQLGLFTGSQSDDGIGEDFLPSADSVIQIQLGEADLAVTKTVDNDMPVLGENIVYTVEVCNMGPSTADDIVILDVLPNEVSFVSAVASAGMYDQMNGEWTGIGPLANGECATLDITVTVDDPNAFENCAAVTGANFPDPNDMNNRGCVTVTPAQEADLAITKMVDNATPFVGDDVVFTLTITNNGPSDATGIMVSDLLPMGLDFVSAVPSQGAYDDMTGVWNVGDIANGGSAMLVLTATVNTNMPVENVATITDSNPNDPNPDNNEARVTVTPQEPMFADLCITKVVNDMMPMVGENVTFTLFAINNGPDDATNVTVLDLLPNGLDYVSHMATKGSYDPMTGVWDIGDLAVNESAVLNITALVTEEGDAKNCATIACPIDDPDLSNNEDCATINTKPSSGGGGAGVESQAKDELAVIFARRLFNRTVKEAETVSKRDAEALPMLRTARVEGESGVHGSGTLASVISNIIPDEGPDGATGFITTPYDLLEVTNATSIFAADYIRGDTRRLGALFAASSPAGQLYDHAKMICDRFGGGVYDEISYVEIKGQQFILAKMIQPTGEIDYAIEFVAYQTNGAFEIENRFSWGEYTPRGDREVLNFQIWTAVPDYTIALVEEILTNMEGLGAVAYQAEAAELPGAYVRTGRYAHGEMVLEIANLSDARQLTFEGTLSRVENGPSDIPFGRRVNLPVGQEVAEITLSTGAIFSATFEIASDVSSARDRLYHADGTWSYGHDDNTRVSGFAVYPQTNQARGDYPIERSASLRGRLAEQGWASLFRWLQPDRGTFDARAYGALEFEARGTGTIEVQLQKASITGTDQYSTTVSLTPGLVTYRVDFADLARSGGFAGTFTPEDLTLIAFYPQSAGEFAMDVENMRFVYATSGVPVEDAELPDALQLAQNYPNPFNPETSIAFAVPESGQVRLAVYDMLGREVAVLVDGHISAGTHRASFAATDLASGTYIYRLQSAGKTLTQKMTLMK